MTVSLVEVDLEHPTLALHFGIPPSPGLRDLLRGECHLEDVLRPVVTRSTRGNLFVVPGGEGRNDASHLLGQLPSRDAFHDFPGTRGVVILDLPPIMGHSYAALAASVADAVVLVIRAGVTPVAVVREAIARLEDRPPRGVVFNGARTSLPSWWPQHWV